MDTASSNLQGKEWRAWLALLRALHRHRTWRDLCATLGAELPRLTGATAATLYWQEAPDGPLQAEYLAGTPVQLPADLPRQPGEVLVQGDSTWATLCKQRDVSMWLGLLEASRWDVESILVEAAPELGALLGEARRLETRRERLRAQLEGLGLQAAGRILTRDELLAGVAQALQTLVDGAWGVAAADEGPQRVRLFVGEPGRGGSIHRVEDEEARRTLRDAILDQQSAIIRGPIAQQLAAPLGEGSRPEWFYFVPFQAGQLAGIFGLGLAYEQPAALEDVEAPYTVPGQDLSGLPRVSARTAALALAMATLRALAQEVTAWIDRQALREESYAAAVRHENELLGLDIHDSVLQDLSYLQIQLGRVEESLGAGADPDSLRGIVQHVRDQLRMVTRTARELAVELTTPSVSTDLLDAVNPLIERFRERFEGEVQFTVSGESRELTATTISQLGRILQEALNNVWKHAQASRVQVELSYELDRLEMSIADNGRGFTRAEARPERLGLGGMQRRVDELGGNLTIDSSVGRGTTVTVTAPV